MTGPRFTKKDKLRWALENASTAAVRDYMAKLGSKGGKAEGKSKARPAAHYKRLADMKRKAKSDLGEQK